MKTAVLFGLFFVAVQAVAFGPCSLDDVGACRDYAAAKKCHLITSCKRDVWKQPINNNTKLCQMCLDDVANLQKFLNAKSTREFVKYDLLSLCNAFPFEFARNECRSLINEHFDDIYQDLVDKLEPKAVCRSLRFCHSSELHSRLLAVLKENVDKFPPKVTLVFDTDNETCEMCKLEFKVIEEWVKDVPEQAIKEELLSFCDNVVNGTDKQQQCHNRVDLNFDLIYASIVGKADPDVLCKFIGLCDVERKKKSVPRSREMNLL